MNKTAIILLMTFLLLGINTRTYSEATNVDCSDLGVQSEFNDTSMFCLKNNAAADARQVNANFKILLDKISLLESLINENKSEITLNAKKGKQVVYLKDLKSTGSGNTGSCTSKEWFTRDLNTLDNPLNLQWITGVNTNRFTLEIGMYEIIAECPAFRLGRHVCKLYNITDNLDSIIGNAANSGGGDDTSTKSMILGLVTVTKNTTFEIQQTCENSAGTTGLGLTAPVGPTIYTSVRIKKID